MACKLFINENFEPGLKDTMILVMIFTQHVRRLCLNLSVCGFEYTALRHSMETFTVYLDLPPILPWRNEPPLWATKALSRGV